MSSTLCSSGSLVTQLRVDVSLMGLVLAKLSHFIDQDMSWEGQRLVECSLSEGRVCVHIHASAYLCVSACVHLHSILSVCASVSCVLCVHSYLCVSVHL